METIKINQRFVVWNVCLFLQHLAQNYLNIVINFVVKVK